ncbi:MAG: trigger factor [Anaerolineae bacterium]|nr:trigger factor [Anaerolineae bacterium]
MNAQTEILENRIAQIKVEVDSTTLEKAKRTAARGLSKRVNIPGFRKGKAPYNIIARHLGEGAILEEAIDQLGPEMYREALADSELEPYAPGQLDSIDTGENDTLVMVFSVPLTPVVELGEYRDIRHDYEAPEVTDKQVDDVLEMMQNNKATTEVKEGPAELGDQVKLDIHGELADTGEASEEEAEEGDDNDSEDGLLFDEHNWIFALGESAREPMPGFSAAVEGMAASDTRTFDLTFPADDEDYDESLRGRTVNFTVTCHEVSTRDVPALDDDFVKSLNEDGVETLEALRAEIREDLQNNITSRAEAEYANEVLDKIVESATIEFPEIMIEETIDDMIQNFENQLAQQGLDLETYLKFSQIDQETLRKDYRESAEVRLKRSLALGELVNAEELALDDRAISQVIRQQAIQFSNGNPEIQQIFEEYLSKGDGRRDIALRLLTEQALSRIVAIGKGEEPPTGPVPFEEDEVEEVLANADEAAALAAAAVAEAVDAEAGENEEETAGAEDEADAANTAQDEDEA